MTAFPYVDIFGNILLIDMPPLRPLNVKTKTLVSGGAPEPLAFEPDTRWMEIKVTTLGSTDSAPDVNVIFADDVSMTFPCGIWTRFRNADGIRLSYTGGGTATVEIREF